MYFIDQRLQTICNQLKLLRFRNKVELGSWQCKFGQYFRPEEADASNVPWEFFNCYTMRWYSNYVGTDVFEGRFEGQVTDFKGIEGAHYWFRNTVTIPESRKPRQAQLLPLPPPQLSGGCVLQRRGWGNPYLPR